jgi:protein TonB
MKRIVLSALIAIGAHVFLLSTHFNLPLSSVALPEIPERLTVVMVPVPMPTRKQLPALLPPPAPELLAKVETVQRLPELPEVIPDVAPVPAKAPPKPKKRLKAQSDKPRPQPSKTGPNKKAGPPPKLQASAQTPAAAPPQVAPAGSPPKKLTSVTAAHKARVFFPDRPAIPLLKENPPPVYPRSARRRGYQGSVVLKVLVGTNGSVEEVQVDQSCGYNILDRTALSAVRAWQFVPGIKDGKKVQMWVKVPVRFELK